MFFGRHGLSARAAWPGVALLVFSALSTFSAGGAATRDSSAHHFDEVSGKVRADFTPVGLRTGTEQLIVKLSGEPVAVLDANALGTLSRDDKQRIAADLEAAQARVSRSIQALGGKVLADFQYAYNGLKVEIPRAAIDELRQLSGVVSVHPVEVFQREHARSVPLVDAPAAWGGVPGATGAGVKVAIIDSGVDYTHANFGGPGTPEAFADADAADTVAPDPAHFGPAAPKIKGGIDLVGDDYDASSDDPEESTPRPDPNPLDCDGHGSHVAGSAAGFGVNPDGSTYAGPYDAATFSRAFRIGPGVAPRADVYAVRVFGCAGSTNVVVEALDWAVRNEMDIVNMSLGLTFGIPDSNPSAEAANNAAKNGVIVVGSAGNSGASPYIVGTPNSAIRTISVAANDPVSDLPGATMALSTGQSIVAQNSNGAAFAQGLSLPVKVLRNADGSVSLGCDPDEYVDVTDKLVVTLRGVCARVARAVFGEQAGAAAVAMINNATIYPPFEGEITGNPDTGEQFNVTIPFFGVRGVLGAGTDGARLVAADAGTVTLTSTNIANPGFKAFATFSSNGPRQGDSRLKPDVTAPGVSILSTDVGTGNRGFFNSGTSMSAPHVTGVAALVAQAHPKWSVEEVKAAIMSTADPALVTGYATSRGGSGFVRAASAARTAVSAFGDDFTSSLSFGFVEVDKDTQFDKKRQIKLRNYGSQAVTFDVSHVLPQGSPHSIELSRTHVTVPAKGGENVDVRLIVPTGTIGSSSAHRQAAGLVKFTPVGGGNEAIALHVPYLLVPRPLAHIEAQLKKNDLKPKKPSTAAIVSNIDGTIASAADFYAWGLEDGDDGLRFNDVRAVGAQTFDAPTPTDAARRFLVFAVNHWRAWSHASINETDIFVDVDNDGTDDYVVVVADFGLLTAGAFDGQVAVAVFSTRSQGGSIAFLASAPTNSSTLLAPVRIWSSNANLRQLCRTNEPCLSEANPRLSYRVQTFGLRLAEDDVVDATARFNAWSSSISQGMFVPLAPNASETVPITVDVAEWAQTPARGVMVVSQDNRNGQDEARVIEVTVD